MDWTGFSVIDVDGHVFELDSVWEQYLEARFQDRRPRIERDARGTTRYQIEGRLIPPGSGPGAWVPEGIVEASLLREGGVDPSARLVDMDTEGIDVAVLYGTIGLGLWNAQDLQFGNALCRAYNNWLHDYCATDRRRLKGTPAINLRDLGEAVREARRAIERLGMVALTLPVRITGRNPDHPDVFPLYQLAEELDVPVTFHAGGGRFTAELFVDQYPLAQACGFSFDIMFGFAVVIGGGLLERFPRLRVSFLEAGASWLPYFLDRLDERFERRRRELPQLKKKPSEYVAEGRVLVSCEPGESALAHTVSLVGADKIVYASDYPHWDADFPDSVRMISERTDLSEADKRLILGDNARRFLRL